MAAENVKDWQKECLFHLFFLRILIVILLKYDVIN